jgi:hypothetical protein
VSSPDPTNRAAAERASARTSATKAPDGVEGHEEGFRGRTSGFWEGVLIAFLVNAKMPTVATKSDNDKPFVDSREFTSCSIWILRIYNIL